MNEKFGIELQLITDKFKSKMDKIKESTSNFARETKRNFSTGLYMDTSQASRELDSLKNKSNETSNVINSDFQRLKTIPGKIGTFFKNAGTAIKGTFDYWIKGANKTKDIDLGNPFEQGIKSAKRFTLSLLSVRSIYSLVSRAASQCMSQNEKLANKMQSAWIGLGSMLEPLLTRLANFIVKVVSYINVFVKALTGIDLLGNAIKKSMDKANGSAKTTQKTLSSFDEVNNIGGSNDSNGTNGAAAWTDAFKNVELNPKVVETLEHVGKIIKDKVITPVKEFWEKHGPAIKDFVVKHFPELLATLVAFGLIKKLGTIAGYLGAEGILAVATIALVAVAVKGIKECVNENSKLQKQLDNNVTLIENQTKSWKEATDKMEGNAEAGKLTTEQQKLYADGLLRTIKSNETMVKGLEEQKNWLGYVTGANKKCTEQQRLLNTETKDQIEKLDKLCKANQLTEDQTKDYLEILKKQRDSVKKNSDEYKTLSSKIDTVEGKLKDMKKTNYDKTIKASVKVEADTKPAKNTLSSFFKNMGSKIFKAAFPSLGGLSSVISKIASLDTGTNYVPSDQLAMIHKGEAIVPKKFNSQQFFNNYSNNSRLEDLLEEVIDRIDNIDFNPHIGVDEIGSASVKYLNDIKKTTGRSAI